MSSSHKQSVLTMVQDGSQNGLGESLSDTQAGLLMTLFVLTFMTLSPVAGYLGDRFSRKWICIVGVTAWCLFTFTGSFATVSHVSIPIIIAYARTIDIWLAADFSCTCWRR